MQMHSNVLAQLIENNHPTVKLTKIEHKLIINLAQDIGTRATLLTDVYGWAPSFAQKATHKDTRAVDMGISRLRKKIEPLNIVVYANRGGGYKLIDLNKGN